MKLGDSFEQPAAVPDCGHSNVLEVLGCYLRQHLSVDGVVVERLFVLLQPEAA
jgi:hypothetical protein